MRSLVQSSVLSVIRVRVVGAVVQSVFSETASELGLLNDFRKFDYRNFLLFLFSIYRNRISFPILRCATVLTYRDRPDVSVNTVSADM